jgi:hypothetical protein
MSDDIAAASSAAIPSVASDSTPSASVPATAAPPESEGSATAPATEEGPIPFGRHKEILENARKKYEAEWQPYSWAKSVDRNQLQQITNWYQDAIQNPYGFYERLTTELQSHPEYGPKVRSYAARLLQQARGAAPETAEPEPDIPIQNESGQITGYTYSAQQLKKLRAFEKAQSQAEFAEKLRPLEEFREQTVEREARVEVEQRSTQWATETLGELRQNPHFKDHEAEIKTTMVEHPEWDIYRAFNHILATTVLPNLSKTEQAKTVASLQQKAAAGTVGARDVAASQRPKFKDFSEALRYMDAHPEEAAAMANR